MKQCLHYAQALLVITMTAIVLDGASVAQAQTTPLGPGVSLRLVSPVGGTALPFTAGQAFRRGDVPSGSTVVANIASFQAVVKNRWADGSVKFAILSGRVDLAANTARTVNLLVSLPPAPSPAITLANLRATGVSASIQFAPFGGASWSGTGWSTPAQTLVTGPQMSAWVFRKSIGADAHLVAWLEVRAYKGGRVEILPWIENGYLRVPNPTEKIGTATFTLGTTQRFSQPLILLNHQRAVLASGTTLTHWLRTDPKITVRHDTAYLMATNLVPNYRGVTAADSSLYTRLPTTYVPLSQVGYPARMGQPAYHPSIGLLPEWDAAYFTTGADPRTWTSAIIHAYSAGRYSIHFRDETTQRPLAFASYPDLVVGGGSAIASRGASSKNQYTPLATGGVPPAYASSHHPSMGYLAYLLSGWNYFLEEIQFVATINYLKQTNTIRQGSAGIFESLSAGSTTRGVAWSIRTLAQAITITPDDDPLRTQLITHLDANISHYHGRYVAIPNNPLGLVQPSVDYVAGGVYESAPWMDDFFTAAFAYTKELQVNSLSAQTKLDAFLTWKFRSVVGRLGGSDADQAMAYPTGAQYTLYYAPTATADWKGGTGPWYANWGEVARAMGLPTAAAPGDPLICCHPIEATYYWANLMPALSYAVDHGAAGALAAWNRVTAASNFPIQAAQYNDNPVWGVKPRTR